MSVVQISSAQDYVELKKRAAEALGLVVHFSASWCEPCKTVSAELATLEQRFGDAVLFAEVSAEVHGDICEAENVDSVPHVIFYRTSLSDKSQVRVAEVSGAKIDAIFMNAASLYGTGKDTKASFPSLEEYMKHLIRRDKIVAFITGSPSIPKCGFTARLCELFGKLNVKYTYYDVMADDEVCAAMKTFSNWPTFPQVYVEGELVGGLDVCTQLQEEGELIAALKMTN